MLVTAGNWSARNALTGRSARTERTAPSVALRCRVWNPKQPGTLHESAPFNAKGTQEPSVKSEE
jgi:hypothetical protein